MQSLYTFRCFRLLHLEMTVCCSSFPRLSLGISEPSGKRFAELFFSRSDPSSTVWKCNQCLRDVHQPGNGIQIYATTLTSTTPTVAPKKLKTKSLCKQLAFRAISYSDKKYQIFGWLDPIVHELLPFSKCKCDVFWRNVKMNCIGRKTLTSYLKRLEQHDQMKIPAALSETFGIVFDGL